MRKPLNGNYLGFHVAMYQTMQMALSCNFEHLAHNYCSIFLSVTTILPAQKKDQCLKLEVLLTNKIPRKS